MKKIFKLTVLFVAIAAVAVSCASPKPKTIENLKAAIAGETDASAKYKAFSAKAAEEGYYNIAKMFAAASAAEAVHIKNHNDALVEMGEEPFAPTAKEPEVNSSMVANLLDAIAGETYEFTVMYPGFIETAIDEDCTDALISFDMANSAEAEHARLYSEALEILNTTGTDETVASVWYVCPRCGDLFNTIEDLDNCPICGVESTSFKEF